MKKGFLLSLIVCMPLACFAQEPLNVIQDEVNREIDKKIKQAQENESIKFITSEPTGGLTPEQMMQVKAPSESVLLKDFPYYLLGAAERRDSAFVKAPFTSLGFDRYEENNYEKDESYFYERYGFSSYNGKYPNITLATINKIESISSHICLMKHDDVAAWDIHRHMQYIMGSMTKHHINWCQTHQNYSMKGRDRLGILESIKCVKDNYTENGIYYTWTKISSNVASEVPDIIFLAHLDVEKTPIDSTLIDSVIAIHYNYGGGNITISQHVALSPDSAGCSELLSMKGKTILTTKGYAPINVDGVSGCTVLETLLGQIAFSYNALQHGNVYFVVCESKADMYSNTFHDTICNKLGCREETIMIALDGESKNSFLTTGDGLASKIITESAADNGYVWNARGIDISANMGSRSWSNIYCGKHAAHTSYEWLCVEELTDLVKITRSIVTKVAENK